MEITKEAIDNSVIDIISLKIAQLRAEYTVLLREETFKDLDIDKLLRQISKKQHPPAP